jgi:HTH-type transcriptional regulator/antitoxin MqsA
MTDPIKCHECGSEMSRDVRPSQVTYKGHSVSIEQPGWYCTNCDEVVLVGADAALMESAFVNLKADVDGILTPSEVQRIRAKLGISQRRAGALLGGGPRSFQKYESGTDWITKSMANLLRLLDRDPGRLAELVGPVTKGRVTGQRKVRQPRAASAGQGGQATG